MRNPRSLRALAALAAGLLVFCTAGTNVVRVSRADTWDGIFNKINRNFATVESLATNNASVSPEYAFGYDADESAPAGSGAALYFDSSDSSGALTAYYRMLGGAASPASSGWFLLSVQATVDTTNAFAGTEYATVAQRYPDDGAIVASTVVWRATAGTRWARISYQSPVYLTSSNRYYQPLFWNPGTSTLHITDGSVSLTPIIF